MARDKKNKAASEFSHDDDESLADDATPADERPLQNEFERIEQEKIDVAKGQEFKTDFEASAFGVKPTGAQATAVAAGRTAKKGEEKVLARYKFRVMVGSSVGADFTQPILEDADGNPRADRKRPGREYKAGEIQWANTDLAKQYNRPNSIKFQLVKDYGEKAYTDGVTPKKSNVKVIDEDPTGARFDAFLNGQNVGDLRSYAAANKINLEGAHRKDEIIERIRNHSVPGEEQGARRPAEADEE